ncbi:hypothetical protein DF186_16800, partial [Enterococcus hirae]
VGGLDPGLAFGQDAHLTQALTDRYEQEGALEHDPSGMLERPPERRRDYTVHRLWPEDAAYQVLEHDDDCRDRQHGPVAVEREKGQRAEH